MAPKLDPVATGHKLCNIASNLRGQAALSRERSERDIFSCVLDGLADALDEAASPMFDRNVKLVGGDEEESKPMRDTKQYVATTGAHCITIMAKALEIRPRRLVAELIDLGWLYRSETHRLKVHENVIVNGWMQKDRRMTSKGSVEIAKALGIDPDIIVRK